VLTPEYVEFDFVLAGMFTRFLAWLVDSVVTIMLSIAVILLPLFSLYLGGAIAVVGLVLLLARKFGERRAEGESLVLPIALLGGGLALAIGGPLVTQLLGWLDWRLTFGALFVLSAAWIPLWYFCFRDDPSQSRQVNAAELAHIRKVDPGITAAPHAVLKSWPEASVLKALLTNRTLLANYWAFFVFGYFLFFFMSWLPSYLERKYGLNLAAVGLFTVLPWLSAAILLWAMGRWSDHLLRTTGSMRISRSWLIAGSQFVAALAVIPVALTDNLTVAIVGITVAVASSMGANAAYYAVNVDIVPERAATALGIMDFAFAIAGFLAPAITGWVLNIRGSFADGFLLMTALALSSVLVVLLFHHPDKDRERA